MTTKCAWDYEGHTHGGNVGLIAYREYDEWSPDVEIVEQVCAAAVQVIRERANREFSGTTDVHVLPEGTHSIRCGQHRHLSAADVRTCYANVEYWKAEQRAELWAEGAVERYLEGGWDISGEYSLDR